MAASLKHVDRTRLHNDLAYRVAWLRDFIGFDKDAAQALHDVAPLMGPLVPTVVDAVYQQLFTYDYTKQVFLRRNEGFAGKLAGSLDELMLDNEQIKFRKDFLSVWAKKVFTANYDDERTWQYLDKVGLMHTGAPGFKHREGKEPLHVDLVACEILLGWVEDILLGALLPLPADVLPDDKKHAAIRAVNKILWIQQDLFQRHYVRTDEENAARKKLLVGQASTADPSEKIKQWAVPAAAGAVLVLLVQKVLAQLA